MASVSPSHGPLPFIVAMAAKPCQRPASAPLTLTITAVSRRCHTSHHVTATRATRPTHSHGEAATAIIRSYDSMFWLR